MALSNTTNSNVKDYCLHDLREIETARPLRSYTSSYADSFIKHSTLVWLKEETFLYITKLEQSEWASCTEELSKQAADFVLQLKKDKLNFMLIVKNSKALVILNLLPLKLYYKLKKI